MQCQQCGNEFLCGAVAAASAQATPCWCSAFPSLALQADSQASCYCSTCLAALLQAQQNTVAEIPLP